MRRRTLLVTAGTSAGVLGLGGFHQRRRIRRWDDRSALHEANTYTVSDPDTGVIITDEHLSKAYSRLDTLIDDAQDALSEVDNPPQTRLPAAINARNAVDPDQSEELTPTERQTALRRLRSGLSAAGRARAVGNREQGTLDGETVRERYHTLSSEVHTYEPNYTAESLSHGVAQYSEADRAWESANRWFATGRDRAGERGEANQLSIAVGYLELIRGDLEDIEYFAAPLEGGDIGSRLETRYQEITTETERIIEETDIAYEGETRLSHAWDITLRGPQGDGETRFNQGLLALATRTAGQQYWSALILDAFVDVPSPRYAADHGYEEEIQDTSGEAVREAKERAVEAFENRFSADGENPLVRYYLQEVVNLIHAGDHEVNDASESINKRSTIPWSKTLEQARLDYLEAAERADQLPNLITFLEDGE